METLKVNNIVKYFYEPEKFQVLKDVTFSAAKGEFLALVGKSGSGKSTLLYVLSTMDTDYQGNLVINNEVMTGPPARVHRTGEHHDPRSQTQAPVPLRDRTKSLSASGNPRP
jgi:ABC-type lipoprotein export system ATPase subunit